MTAHEVLPVEEHNGSIISAQLNKALKNADKSAYLSKPRGLINRLHSSHQSNVKPFENAAGILTYDLQYTCKRSSLLRSYPMDKRSSFVKYSNGGCYGFEPYSLFRQLRRGNALHSRAFCCFCLLSLQLFKPHFHINIQFAFIISHRPR